MAREFSRTQRVADYLLKDVAQVIQQEMRDPRTGLVSVNAVHVSRDLSFAKVYVTFLGKETEAESREGLEVLNNAAGFLRSQLAKGNHMRTTPRLQFVFDTSVRQGEKISTLLNQVVDDNKSSDDEG